MLVTASSLDRPNTALPAPSVAIVPQTDDLIAEWLVYEAQRGLKSTSAETYRRGVRAFIQWIEAEGLAGRTIRPSDILAFKGYDANHYSPSTVNIHLSAIRAFFRWLVVTDRLPANPASEVQGVRRPDAHIHKRDALTSSEVLAVLDACKDTPTGRRDRAIITLMAYCALRTIEIVRADMENLKTQSDRMVLEVWGKGRSEPDEIAVIPRPQEAVIRAWVSVRMKIRPHGPKDPLFISFSRATKGERISTRGVRAIVKGLFEDAGVVGIRKTTHSLRHTGITRAIENGADPLQVQAMARHSSFDTTKRYYHEVTRVSNPAEDLIEYE